jgi:nickel/cobalt transporter (NiCoT) family protein
MKALARRFRALDRGDRRELRGYGAAIAGLHLLGWGLVAIYAPGHPVLGGLGVLAYSFGLRHAFDADHISAIDNTTRKLIAEGGRPLGVGFYFSLGHSTVVLALAAALAVAAGAVHHALPALALYGGVVGAGVSGIFLWVIGALNASVLAGIIGLAREARHGRLEETELEAQLSQRGLISRVCKRRFDLIQDTRQMYPVGFLFGLGFDTATEVALLSVTASLAGGGVPAPALLALPVLFAAGMSAMDTADGVFMSTAYGWALSTPIRKIYYNLTVTGLSVVVAFVIGTVELLQVIAHQLALRGPVWSALQSLNFSNMGYAIVVLFVVAWLVAAAVWRWCRIEQRWQRPAPTAGLD